MLDRVREIMSERGASAVEYGLLVAGIAAVVIAAVFLLGTNVNEAFGDVNRAVVNGGDTAPAE